MEGESGHARLTSVDGERIFLDSNQGGLRRHIAMDFIPDARDWLARFSLMHTSAYSYINFSGKTALSVLQTAVFIF